MIVAFAMGNGMLQVLEKQESGVGESGRADKAAFDTFPERCRRRY